MTAGKRLELMKSFMRFAEAARGAKSLPFDGVLRLGRDWFSDKLVGVLGWKN